MSLLDVFAMIGGLLKFLTVSITFMYGTYNYLILNKFIVGNTLLGGNLLSNHSEDYNLRPDYFKIKYQNMFCCCKGRCLKKVQSPTAKYINLKASETLI